jgi:hypothetical protein
MEEEADEVQGEEEAEEEIPRQSSKRTHDGSETEDEKMSFWPKSLVNTEFLLHPRAYSANFCPD